MSDNTVHHQYRRRIIAHHEAGHAVVAVKLGSKFDAVELPAYTWAAFAPDGWVSGTVEQGSLSSDKSLLTDLQRMWERILTAAAGPVAEARAQCDTLDEFPRRLKECLNANRSEGSDAWMIETLFGFKNGLIAEYPEQAAMIEQKMPQRGALMETTAMVFANWHTITRVADALIERGRLSFDEVVILVAEC